MTRRLLVVLFVFALVVAACSSDDSTDEETTTTAAAAAGEETTTTEAMAEETTTTSGGDEAAGAVTIRWRTRPDNDQEAAVYSSISDSLQSQIGGVTLTYEAGGTETEGYQQALLTQLAAGEAPDVFWIPGADIAEFASKGVILDLAPYAAADPDFSVDDFYPGPMAQLTTDPATGQPGDVLWGLPRDVSTFGLYVSLLKQAHGTGRPSPTSQRRYPISGLRSPGTVRAPGGARSAGGCTQPAADSSTMPSMPVASIRRSPLPV